MNGDGGSPFGMIWRWCTIDNVLRFPTQKYIVIKDRTLVRDCCTAEGEVVSG